MAWRDRPLVPYLGAHPALRALATAFLLVVAVFTGLVALGALSNLWTDGGDSGPVAYVLFGVPFAAVALAASALPLARSLDRGQLLVTK